MKKIILLSGIIIATLASCSTEDMSTYEQNSNKTILNKEKTSDFCITCRDTDTIYREGDSIYNEIDPVKPKKD